MTLIASFSLSACALFSDDEGTEDETEPNEALRPRLVGTVASVNEPQRFVLIEGFEEFRLSEGLLLSSFGTTSERAATLVASGERMGRYSAADWKSGEVEVGDQVYSRPLSKPKPSEPSPNADLQAQNGTQNAEISQ